LSDPTHEPSPSRAPASPEPAPGRAGRGDPPAGRTGLRRATGASPPVAIGLGAGLSCVFLAHDLWALPTSEALGAALVGVTAAAAIIAIAGLRAVDRLRLAVTVDRALGLRGRLGNALALAGDFSELARLARRDADRRAAELDPARILPYRRPRGWLLGIASLAVSLVLLGVGPIERRAAQRVVGDETPRLAVSEPPAAIDPDALAALRERMAETRHEGEVTPEAQAATDALNTLIEDLAAGELTEDEALARIAELESSLDRGAAARSAEIQRELAETAREMRDARSTDALARALAEGRLEDASRELRAIAQRTRTEPPPRELIENLRAMAQDREREARERELEEAEQENERLLERRREREERGEPPPPEEERLLEQRQRELDRLRREHEARQEVERELDRLRRELGDAAERMDGARAAGGRWSAPPRGCRRTGGNSSPPSRCASLRASSSDFAKHFVKRSGRARKAGRRAARDVVRGRDRTARKAGRASG